MRLSQAMAEMVLYLLAAVSSIAENDLTGNTKIPTMQKVNRDVKL
jgi:hypothetical protein